MEHILNAWRKINVSSGPDKFECLDAAESLFHHKVPGNDAYRTGSSRMAVNQDSLAVCNHFVNEINGIVAQPQIVSGSVHQWDANHVEILMIFIAAVLLQAKNCFNVTGRYVPRIEKVAYGDVVGDPVHGFMNSDFVFHFGLFSFGLDEIYRRKVEGGETGSPDRVGHGFPEIGEHDGRAVNVFELVQDF